MATPSSYLACIKRYALAILLNRTASFSRVTQHLRSFVAVLYRLFAHRMSPFWIHLVYFVALAFSGSLALMLFSPSNPSFSPRYVDMFYLSTSALTVSGLATVKMEDLSSSQVVVFTLLMLLGGEVFVSLLSVLLRRPKSSRKEAIGNSVGVELDSMELINGNGNADVESGPSADQISMADGNKDLKHSSIRCLGYVILGYHLLFHVAGTVFILVYVTVIRSAGDVLRGKKINAFLFSLSLTVSSFANGGLVPTNENMIVFNENSGLLLAVTALVFVGNTLFPLMLKVVIWALSRITRKAELQHMVKNPRDVCFSNLLPCLQTAMVSLTVVGFVALQVALFCAMDWGAAVFDGMNSYQKVVNALFMAANTRHAGEGTVDLSTVSAAVNVLFVVMMFLPSSTSFTPVDGDDDDKPSTARKVKKERKRVQDLILPPLSILVLFVIAICITERKKLSRDPVNFSVFNILFEVISGYGNVGLSIGYGCARQVHPGGSCVDQPYSFSGWWSDGGKVILAMVMLYGRLKKYSMKNGRAWSL